MENHKEVKEDIQEELNRKQNEYQEILLGMTKDKKPLGVDDCLGSARSDKWRYNWERLKDLQQSIIHLTHMERERSIMLAKEALEQAFTPKLKKMLSDKLQKEIDE